MSQKRVLSVGQCAMDHGNITRMMQKQFSATVASADTKEEALDLAERENFDLVLVNRLLDANCLPGLDIIKAFKEHEALRQLPIMLISNFEDAQKEAIALGAVPGFGKSALEHPQSVARIAAILQDQNPV